MKNGIELKIKIWKLKEENKIDLIEKLIIKFVREIQIPDIDSQIQSAFVSISKRSDVKKALARFWGNVQGLAPIESFEYEYLSTAVDDLELTEEDCLRQKKLF